MLAQWHLPGQPNACRHTHKQTFDSANCRRTAIYQTDSINMYICYFVLNKINYVPGMYDKETFYFYTKHNKLCMYDKEPFSSTFQLDISGFLTANRM